MTLLLLPQKNNAKNLCEILSQCADIKELTYYKCLGNTDNSNAVLHVSEILDNSTFVWFPSYIQTQTQIQIQIQTQIQTQTQTQIQIYDFEWNPPLSGSLFPAPLHLSQQIQLHPRIFSLKLQIFKSLGFVPYLGFSIRAPWPRAFDLILDLGFRQQRSNKRGTTQKSIFFSDPFPWLKLLVSNKLIFIMHIFLTIMTNIAFKSPKYGHFEAQYNCCYSTNCLWENNFSCWPKVLGCLYCLLQAQELKHAKGCWNLCVCMG